MKKIISLISISFAIITFIWISLALDVPANDGYVLDQTKSLTTEQEQALESKIHQARQYTDIEIWILIINSLEGEDIFNYSLNVAEIRWVGDEKKDNGLLMLFAMDDRERRIQVWYGLEWIITDSIAKRFWEKNIADNFRAWLYFDWINNTLQDIIDYIQKDPAALEYINASTNNVNSDTTSNSIEEGYFAWFIALIFAIKSLVLKYDPKKKKSKVKKWWRIALAIIWAVMWIIGYLFVFPWQVIQSWIFWYIISLVWVGVWILMGNWNTVVWAMLLWPKWWSRWWFWWGSSFGWFWGGGFWWGGGGWKR